MRWHGRFLDLAHHVAEWSKDPSTKVGAVLVDQHRVVRGLGYNGFPRGVDDLQHRLHERELKYPMTVHAEVNAVLQAGHLARGGALYTTMYPCADCAGVIIQAGVGTVYLSSERDANPRWAEHSAVAGDMFREAGVLVLEVEPG